MTLVVAAASPEGIAMAADSLGRRSDTLAPTTAVKLVRVGRCVVGFSGSVLFGGVLLEELLLKESKLVEASTPAEEVVPAVVEYVTRLCTNEAPGRPPTSLLVGGYGRDGDVAVYRARLPGSRTAVQVLTTAVPDYTCIGDPWVIEDLQSQYRELRRASTFLNEAVRVAVDLINITATVQRVVMVRAREDVPDGASDFVQSVFGPALVARLPVGGDITFEKWDVEPRPRP